MNRHRCSFASEHTAAILRQSDFCTCDLAFVGFATQLPENFSQLGDAGGSDWMPFGQQTATWVDWNTAAERRDTLVNQTSTFTLLAQPELFVNNQFSWR